MMAGAVRGRVEKWAEEESGRRATWPVIRGAGDLIHHDRWRGCGGERGQDVEGKGRRCGEWQAGVGGWRGGRMEEEEEQYQVKGVMASGKERTLEDMNKNTHAPTRVQI